MGYENAVMDAMGTHTTGCPVSESEIQSLTCLARIIALLLFRYIWGLSPVLYESESEALSISVPPWQ